jgi:hypothetical protein
MAEFKKISDVDVVTELAENDNILVVGSDGALKQTASSNVKGSTSWNDLTDKPFYDEVTLTEILHETTAEIAEDNSTTTITTSATIEVGKNYKVVFDGVEYNCTAFEWGSPCLGNGIMIGSTIGNNEPFFIGVNGGGSWFVLAQTGGNHKISVAQVDEEIKKIDEKYLPDMGSSGSGSCGIEYWTGDVTWDSESNMFTLQGLELSTGEEVEIGIRLNYNSNAPSCAKYSFISGVNNDGISMYSLEYAHNTLYPRARLRYVYSDSGHVHQLYLTSSTETDAVSMSNPQILFVRVYRMV